MLITRQIILTVNMFVNLLIINNYMQVMEIWHTNTASYSASNGKKWKPMDREQKKACHQHAFSTTP